MQPAQYGCFSQQKSAVERREPPACGQSVVGADRYRHISDDESATQGVCYIGVIFPAYIMARIQSEAGIEKQAHPVFSDVDFDRRRPVSFWRILEDL